MFFCGNVYASDIEKNISIRVEGINNTIIKSDNNYSTQKSTVYDAVYDILQNNNIPIITGDSQYGKYITSINKEVEGTFGGYDGWLYAVNGIGGSQSIDACNINDGDNIVIYYGGYSPQTHIPEVSLSSDEVVRGNTFKIRLSATYFDWNTNKNETINITGAAIKLLDQTYTTDANGEAVITAPSNPGNYLLHISQERDNNYPLLVRTDKSITVTDEPVVLPDAKGYVTISVEKFTLGQGYYKEPVKVPFYDGDNGASILTRLVGEGNYKSTGRIGSGFYLSKIKDADTSNVNVPQYIVDQAGGIDSKESNEWLGEFDYTGMSGWMYAVNNEFPNVGCSDYTPQDGDVIRWQFTVYGYGADLGGGWGETYIQPADKDALTAKVAEINSDSNRDIIISKETVKTAYYNAYAVLKNMESTQESVEQALTQLNDALNEAKDTIAPVIVVEGLEDQQEVTEKDLNFTVEVTDNHDENITPTVKQNGEIVTGTDGKYKLVLTDGENTITIEATDKAGNKADITYKLIYKTITTNSPKEQLDKNLAYILKTVDNPTFGTGGGEWSILSLARANYNVPKTYYDTYYNNVVNKVNELMTKYAGKLDKNKGTENSRLILGLTAIGKDISNVSGYDIRNALSDYTFVKKQGINGPVFALIALDSKNYEIPIVEGVSVQTTRQMLIDFILDKEIKKGTDNAGGWALSGTAPDPDITAMAIQGLTPYYKSQDNVKAAVDRAICWLSTNQKADGGYASWGTVNAESIAQVVVALTGLGIDPHTDLRFVKNGKSAIDALLTFAVPEGGFMHLKPGSTGNGGAAAGVVDGMATDQGTYALVAYDRLVNGKTGLYDMTDVSKETEEAEEQLKEETIVPNDSNDFEKTITDKDSNKEITIRIPSEKNARVIVKLISGSSLPKIEAVKGNVSVVITKGTQITSGDALALELITTKNKNDTSIKAKINKIIPTGKKLDEIAQIFTMGGNGKVEFNDFITLTFTGMKGKETAYIQDGSIHAIQKFASDLEGINSGRNEYAYDSENDLIVKTKHFTDFIAYTTSASTTETPGSGEVTDPQPKKYVTLSVDKLTINKGYVIPSGNIELNEGDTAWMLLKRELDSRGISYEYEWTEKYDSVYVQAIAGDGEFDHGSGSGWMYNVNGHYPNYGSSKYILKDGDVLQWRYTTNLGADLGEDLSQWKNNTDAEKPVNGTGTTGTAGTAAVTTPEEKKETDGEEKEQTNIMDIGKLYADSTDISAWAYEAVKSATQKGVVAGSNGKFSPKSNITRAEFTKIMVSVLELDINIDNVITFTDVDGKDWFYPYVNAAYKAGFIVGCDNKFNPNENITREQMAVIIAKALKLNAMKSNTVFKDINLVSAWAKADVDTIYTLGLMVGDNNKFNPKAFATREMAVVVAMKAFDYKNGTKLENGEVEKYIEETGELMQKTITDPVVASVGGEWTVLSLARSGINVPESYNAKYYTNVEKKLKETSGKLHNVKYTEYDRVILALGSIGKDVTNVAGYDLTKPLADFNTVIKQGLNGPIWALIALDSKAYQIPIDKDVAVQTTREMLVDYILSKELNGGGWSLTSEAPADTDITAMALQALSKYQDKEDVKAAINRALNYLSTTQQKDGSFKSTWGDEISSESVAQVIVALTTLDIDPKTDKRFIKNGNDTITALLAFYVGGGGFKHTLDGELDAMATDQGMYALVAYNRFINGQKQLYDMTDIKK